MKRLKNYSLDELLILQQEAVNERDFETLEVIEIEINERFSPDSYFNSFLSDLL